jgi:hypothetical protein
MPLALAVNGRIAATAEGFSSRGAKKLNWAAMIPPSAYKDGRNAIDVYEILGARRLAKIGSAP